MKISIVTPSFNQAAFIADAVESVVKQGYAPIEHLVLDNCSSDGTMEILSHYPNLRLVREPDKGQSDALNKGFEAVSGDIIGWLNADDRYLPGCFETVSKFFGSNPSCDIVYGDYRLIDEAGKVLSNRKELEFDLFMLKYLHVLYIPSTTVFFRRRIFDDGNFLDTQYHYSMDYEFFLRLALKGYRFSHIPAFLADFRTHKDSKSCRQWPAQRKEREVALLKHDQRLAAFNPLLRQGARALLMSLARLKRSALKLIGGAYGA